MAAAVAQQQQQQGAPGAPGVPANKQCLTVNLVLQRCRMNDPFHVRRMNVCGCALEDISVMEQFSNVEVCSFAVNDISDLEALRNCHRLQELFLRKNRIADFGQLLHLSHLPLRSLGLAENPISNHTDYRKFVISAMPSLTKLDDQEITPAERSEAEHEISDPFATAMELGVASAPPIAGRPSSTALQGNMDMLASTSTPPRTAKQQQDQQQVETSSPYDAFAATTTKFNNNRKQQQQQEQQDPLAMTSPVMMKRNINNNSAMSQQQQQQPNNRYNGDDVPIGGGPAAVAAPRPRTANNNTAQQQQQQGATSNFLAKKREHMRQQQQQQTQEPQQQQMMKENTSFNEDAAVKAVKVLLEGMSASGLAQVKRYVNTL